MVFFSAGAHASHDEKYGDAFVTASIGDARNLIPCLASDSSSAQVSGLIFNGLIKYSPDLTLIPDLAESWEILDNGLTVIFHLRKNVKWQDGAPFTGGDVKFTYERLIDPKVPTPYGGDFEKVKSFELIDDYTIKITYKEPFSPGLASWSMGVLPKHILDGEDFLTTPFARSPIGTGPYKFKRWRTGERIDLVSNHEYFEHRPYIDRYIYRIIPDTSTMFLELETRNIDAMVLTPLQYKRLTDTRSFKDNFNKYTYPSFGYTYLGYNLDCELFRDKRVRQALNYAVNKDEIIDGILLGLGKVSTGPFMQGSWAYNKEVKAVPYDPSKAELLLKEAGWREKNKDGWLTRDGKIFEFTVITNQGNNERIRTAEIIQKRLKDIGVKMNVRVLEWSVFLNEFIDKKKFEACLLAWNLSPDPDCFDIWHSSKTKPGEFNFLGYKNPEVDSLLDEGRKVFDIEKRKAIYNKIHEIIYDDQPCMFLFSADALIAVSKRFENVKPTEIGIMYNFIDWFVPRGKRRY